MLKKKPAPCEFCPGKVRPRVVTIDLRRGKALVVVNRVPAFVCDRCGYKEFSAEVAKKLRQVLLRKVKARRKVSVPVVEFGSVA